MSVSYSDVSDPGTFAGDPLRYCDRALEWQVPFGAIVTVTCAVAVGHRGSHMAVIASEDHSGTEYVRVIVEWAEEGIMPEDLIAAVRDAEERGVSLERLFDGMGSFTVGGL